MKKQREDNEKVLLFFKNYSKLLSNEVNPNKLMQ